MEDIAPFSRVVCEQVNPAAKQGRAKAELQPVTMAIVNINECGIWQIDVGEIFLFVCLSIVQMNDPSCLVSCPSLYSVDDPSTLADSVNTRSFVGGEGILWL